jgi:hypothetical protein
VKGYRAIWSQRPEHLHGLALLVLIDSRRLGLGGHQILESRAYDAPSWGRSGGLLLALLLLFLALPPLLEQVRREGRPKHHGRCRRGIIIFIIFYFSTRLPLLIFLQCRLLFYGLLLLLPLAKEVRRQRGSHIRHLAVATRQLIFFHYSN